MRWRRIIGWTLAIVAVLITVALVGGLLFLRTASFQRLAIRTIVEDVDQATGSRTEIRDFDFKLSTLTAHLRDITVHGTEAAGQSPLLHVDEVTVGLKIQSILRRKVSLRELLIEHPVAFIRIDREGKSNLPQPPQKKQSSSKVNVFDVAVGHVLLTGGQINYNDASVPVVADLYDLKTEIHFEPLETKYRGTLSYNGGRIRYGTEPVFPHSLDASFSATPARFSLESALLKVGASSLSMQADITNYSNPIMDGRYDVRIRTQDFSPMLHPAASDGDVSLSGAVHYQRVEGQPFLRGLSMDGRINSEDLTATLPQGHLNFRRLQGNYKLLNSTLQARGVNFETLGGRIAANAEIKNLDSALPETQVQASLQNILLQDAQHVLHAAQVRRVHLLSSLDGTVNASWTGSFSKLHARADLALKAAPGRDTAAIPSMIPLGGSIHATYDGPKNILTFRETSLHIPSTTIAVQGEVGNHSSLQIQASTADLHQLMMLFSAARGGSPPTLEIAGAGSLQAIVRGSLQSPQFSGQFDARNLHVQGSAWSSAKFAIEADSSGVSLRNASLISAHQGKASISGKIGLQHWSYLPANPIAVNLSIQRMSVGDLQRLASVDYPVSGDLSAEITLHGSQLKPIGSGSLTVNNAHAYDEPIQHLKADFHADRSSLTSTFDLNLPAGSANGNISYTPETKAYVVHLSAPSLALQKLQTVQAKNLGISGTLTITASGAGTLSNPELTAALELPQLHFRDKSISQIKAQLHVANKHAELSLDSQVAQASLHSKVDVNLSGDYYTEAVVDTTRVPLDPLLAMYLPSLPEGFQGETELHATLKGPLKDKSRVEAHLTLPILKAGYQSLEIGAASPIHLDYANSVITLQPAEFRGTDTSLRVQGRIPLGENAAPNLTAQGSIDVRILRIVDPDLQSSGTLLLDVHASGTAKEPQVQGQVRLQDVAISTPSAPLGVEKLNGTLDISNNSLQISSLEGQMGGGQVSVGGSIAYKPNLQFNVSLQSKSVRLRYPTGVRAVLDSNLVLIGTKDASTLNGRVLIDTLSFTPDFDLSKFSDQFNGSAIPAQPGLADNIKLAVGVQSKSKLSATSSQISVEGQVNLQVVGTAANPVIIGRTDLTSGEFFYRNVRYELQRGIITFDNPAETEPVLNVSVTTTVEQYKLTLTLRGPFDKLTTSYTSDPPLATADIINLIANGQTTQEAAAAGQSTDSMIASQVAGQVTGGIQHLAGISALQIDPLLGGNQNPSARVAIQQRVTKNFLFTFSTDLSQPGSEIVQGDYRINKRWSMSVTRDEVGGISVDGKYHTKF
ncbi:MAG: translocation/assembly module TamB domain-containing protein [Candidatus Sulfotelmatobacter sp.]